MKDFRDFGIDLPSGAHGETDTTCPECSPRRKKHTAKCLSVNVDDGTWYCHHCQWTGTLKDGQRNPSDPAPYGEAERPPKTYSKPRPVPAVTVPDAWARAVAWFAKERGIDEATLIRNGVTSAIEWCPVCEGKLNHILFPSYRDGAHVNTKHRCPHKHFRMEKNAERILYGLPDIVGQSTIVIVEGEIDKLSLEMAGYRNCVSVPDGAPSPDAKNYSSKFAFLESAETIFKHATKVILAVDADAPGQALQEELSRRIGVEKCWRVTWPDGIKDANECLVKTDAAELARVIGRAEPYPFEGIVTIDDISRDIDDLYDHGFDPGQAAGVGPKFDRIFRFRTGLMTIWTGIAGHGKSNFLDQCLVGLARQGWNIAICSPENQPLQRHAAGIMAKYVGLPFHDGPTTRMTRQQKDDAKAWMAEHFTFVLPEEPTIDAILERATALVYRHGIKMLIIDPWNELDHSRDPHLSETEYISQCLGKYRNWLRNHKVHGVLTAHPTKMKRATQDGPEPIPELWDISGSSHFRNKADQGVCVWRDIRDIDVPTQVHVQKIRFQETGDPGMVEFKFDRAVGSYREIY